MYASSARSPEFGYLVTHVIVHGTVDVEKPALPQLEEEPGTPPLKARRPVHWGRASGRGSSRPRSSSSSRSRRATPSRGRRSSSTPRPPSRSRPDAERGSTRTRSSTSPPRREHTMATVEAGARARAPGRHRMGRQAPRGDARRLRAPVRRHRPLRGPRSARDDGLRSDRLREALLAAARRSRLRARDRAEHLRLTDRPRARRAVLRAVQPRGRLDRSLDGDHRPRPHDVRRDQVDGPQRLRGQPRDPAGRHLREQRPDDRRRAQRRRPDVRPDLLGGRAARAGPVASRTSWTSARARPAACPSGRRRATRTASTCPA